MLALLSLVVLMGGAAIRDALDLGEAFDSVWRIARWPLGVAFAVASVALLFEYSPRRRQPEASWLAFGAGVSAILWLLFMAGLALYMDATDSFGATYGPIAGTIGVLLDLLHVDRALPRPGLRGAARGRARRRAQAARGAARG